MSKPILVKFNFNLLSELTLMLVWYPPQAPTEGWRIWATREQTWSCYSWWPGASGHSGSSSALQCLHIENFTPTHIHTAQSTLSDSLLIVLSILSVCYSVLFPQGDCVINPHCVKLRWWLWAAKLNFLTLLSLKIWSAWQWLTSRSNFPPSQQYKYTFWPWFRKV